ncbi:type II toxin-antitoxin system HipA family toxin [Acidocella sp.]|uniref:type II toxin-antitoxin system HipA family toxin n=1 Tax=Acidocella sp. TaxID=50710 RepID=UPI003D016893
MAATPVFYETQLVGEIQANPDGLLSFNYADAWRSSAAAFPISVLAPLSATGMPPSVFTPWLTNLLPEGHALTMIGKTAGVSPGDVLGILDRVGRDTAGALSFGGPAERGEPRYSKPAGDQLERIINDLPKRPFLVETEGVSMSLAGAQEKLPVVLVNGEIAIPLNNNPSTHILKPDNSRLEGSVQNEALCLTLARLLGLNAASVTTGRAGARSYLLVERYDRMLKHDEWTRLHQEDFCQASGKPPASKYEHNQSGLRGPSLPDLFDVAARFLPPRDRLALLDAAILNVLITNVDSHAKNYSILIDHNGARLAPLYDLMCGRVWENITKNMAQEIGGQRRGRHLYRRHWKRLAEACGFNKRMVVQRVVKLANQVIAKVDNAAAAVAAMPAGGHWGLELAVNEIKNQANSTIRNAEAVDQLDGAMDEGGLGDDGELISPVDS